MNAKIAEVSAYRRNDVSAWPEHEHLVYAETPKLRYADTFALSAFRYSFAPAEWETWPGDQIAGF